MKTLLIGHKIENPKFDQINLMINVAQLVVYNYHVKCNLKKLNHSNKRLMAEFVSSFKYHLNHSGFCVSEVKKIIDML